MESKPFELRIVADEKVIHRNEHATEPIPEAGDLVEVQGSVRQVQARLFAPYDAPAGYPDALMVTLFVEPVKGDQGATIIGGKFA